jgi:hypothetical protein
MNKWLQFILFYAALGISVAHEGNAWVRLAWLLPFLAVWLLSFVGAIWWGWKNRHAQGADWQPTANQFSFLPRAWKEAIARWAAS